MGSVLINETCMHCGREGAGRRGEPRPRVCPDCGGLMR